MIRNTLVFDEDIENLKLLFESEDKEFPNGRAGYDIEFSKGVLNFNIWAKDFIGYKAVMNSIIKVIDVYYKVKDI